MVVDDGNVGPWGVREKNWVVTETPTSTISQPLEAENDEWSVRALCEWRFRRDGMLPNRYKPALSDRRHLFPLRRLWLVKSVLAVPSVSCCDHDCDADSADTEKNRINFV